VSMPDKVILAMVLSSTVGTVYCISCPRGILTTILCIYNAIFRNHITADAHSVESTRHHLVAIACLLVESLTIQILEVICASLQCQSMRFFAIQKLYKGLHWGLQDSIERKHLQKLTALTASIAMFPSTLLTTVPFHSIRQSRVTGAFQIPKCHGRHGA